LLAKNDIRVISQVRGLLSACRAGTIRALTSNERDDSGLAARCGTGCARPAVREQLRVLEGAVLDPGHRHSARDELRDDLKKVQEHVQGVLDGFTDWDVETAKGLEG